MPTANCSCLLPSHASFQHASVPTVVLWLLPDSPPRKARLSVLLQDGRHETEVDGAVRDGHVSVGQEPQARGLWLPDRLRIVAGGGSDAWCEMSSFPVGHQPTQQTPAVCVPDVPGGIGCPVTWAEPQLDN